ncbi:hypothetical protein AWC02_10125 [Mycolicibacter engbaekii]|uniref:Uncharacterized protein n=1 Tax=Mycolicibacter engbaekii TaxID=188915 RepID=A0A1X1TR66_9MYCO|nr:hypothetical protein AWC02_10125 [Mycolicibacter engbaekii]
MAQAYGEDRSDQFQFLMEKSPTVIDLQALGLAVSGRVAVDDIRDEDLVLALPCLVECIIDVTTAAASERYARFHALTAQTLPDDDHGGIYRAKPRC